MIGKQTVLSFINDLGHTYVQKGFTSTQKGMVLKYKVPDNDFVLIIKFHVIHNEGKGSVSFSCAIMVLSEQLKEWRLKNYRSRDLAIDTVFVTQLQDVIPQFPKKFNWEITQKNIQEFKQIVQDLLLTYVNPLLNFFLNKQILIEYIIKNGWRLNEYMLSKNFIYPVDFMCCFATYEQSVQGFNNYLKREGLVQQAKRVYKEINSPKYKGFISSDAIEDKVFQLAYLHKIPIIS
ncbi:hypothetical protein LNQ81_17460 [Myroides sp. M-43]|uniref:hypothetical protein n=1 Tax=Myroides oncorhynchi TaxID=2893756 RepID=UPI001E4842BA|nr:hypothetical protein [Myroides oncorhynchi]MCC9044459.1 hypothetical protein [Myroides oncorhynchi]